MIWHVMRVWYMWLVFWGYLTKLSGLQLWFNDFQVLQETVARRRRDRTAPHDYVDGFWPNEHSYVHMQTLMLGSRFL